MLYIILVQGFCPLKIKITQFPDGFRLKTDTCFGLRRMKSTPQDFNESFIKLRYS